MAKENFAQHDIISPHGYTYPAWKEIKESSILNEDHIGTQSRRPTSQRRRIFSNYYRWNNENISL